MYTVYGTLRSRAFRVLWTLEEMGQPYRLVSTPPRSDAAFEVNPSGKIPVLQDGAALLTDSVAIMSYLADKHGQLTFPAGTVERARQDAWLHQINDEIDSTLWTATRHTALLPEDRRVPAVAETCKWDFSRSAARIEDALEGPFLMGEHMTIADILLTHCLGWARGSGFPETGDRLRDYARTMRAREAFRRALALEAG